MLQDRHGGEGFTPFPVTYFIPHPHKQKGVLLSQDAFYYITLLLFCRFDLMLVYVHCLVCAVEEIVKALVEFTVIDSNALGN